MLTPPAQASSEPRFDVAFSLAGEDRSLIEPIAVALKQRGYAVFYYCWPEYVAELAVPNLDLALRHIYGRDTRLLVPVLSASYARKPWTGEVEFTVVRELIFTRRDEAVMALKVDDAAIEGFSTLHGYVSLETTQSGKVADLIVLRIQKLAADSSRTSSAVPSLGEPVAPTAVGTTRERQTVAILVAILATLLSLAWFAYFLPAVPLTLTETLIVFVFWLLALLGARQAWRSLRKKGTNP